MSLEWKQVGSRIDGYNDRGVLIARIVEWPDAIIANYLDPSAGLSVVQVISVQAGKDWVELRHLATQAAPAVAPQSFRPDAVLSLFSLILAALCVAAVLYMRFGR